jgi:hypothetical protein
LKADEYTLPNNGIMSLEQPKPAPKMSFMDANGNALGVFDYVDGKWTFDGDCDASAQLFVDAVLQKLQP